MGLISFLVEEVAKDIAFNATVGIAGTIAGGVEKASEKRDEKRKGKLLKTKKHQNSFLISHTNDDLSFFLSKTKARYYEVRVGDTVVYSIKRVLQKDGNSMVEIRDSDGKTPLGLINEVVQQKIPIEKAFIISEGQSEVGRVYTNEQMPYRYVDTEQNSWDLIQNDKEYLISKTGKTVARCKNNGLKLRKNSLFVTYNEKQPPDAMLYLSLCLFLSLDPIK